MSEEKKETDFVNVTDCLEAIGVFKAMKNFLFVVIFVCLILLAICFWLTDQGMIKNGAVAPAEETVKKIDFAKGQIAVDANGTVAMVAQVAEKVSSDPNAKAMDVKADENGAAKKSFAEKFSIDYFYISKVVRGCNFVLMMTATMYCLVLMFCLKVSLVGRLGGLNHISRAFFISLFVLIFLFPWQRFFGVSEAVAIGAIYLPRELLNVIQNRATFSPTELGWHYLRFVCCWAIAVILLLSAQIRSAKWANTTLRRLGIE
jgi:hypothetical protein